jgi:hypothetical protein
MLNRIRVNRKLLMVVTSVVGVPILVVCWFLNNGIPMFSIAAPEAYDRFFENSEVSDLSGGGSTWLDYEIDLRFKTNKQISLKNKDRYKPGNSVIEFTDQFLRLYPDDAYSFLDTSELECWSRVDRSETIYYVYNKRTKLCFFHAEG